MSEEISSPVQITSEEFDLICKGLALVWANAKRGIVSAERMYTGRVTTETKIENHKQVIQDCDDLESKLAQEFS